MRISRARSIFNRLFGFDVVRVAGQHTLRTHLKAVLDTYRIDTVIDVGANEGGFAKMLRDLGFQGSIHSFEPVAAAYKELEAAARSDVAWEAYACALGAQDGKATINVSRFNQMSSFLSASSYATGRWPNIKVEATEVVEVRTLSSFFENGNIQSTGRVLLKMDTQGFDLEVFRGASSIRDQLCCILSELSLLPVYEGMPDFSESLETYRRSGFAVTGFFPITRNADLALNEVDCMLVDKSRLMPPDD